jgi:hypothetical protein
MKVLIIIPAYNEGKNLSKLFDELRQYCPQYDIVVVNDCSKDNTLEVCKRNFVDVIDLPVNLGIGGAVQAGYKYALQNGYDIAVQVDGDGQHDPAYIDTLIDGLMKGSDLCIGSRFLKGDGYQSTISRRIGIKYFCRLIHFFTGQWIKDPTSGFRACNRKALSLFVHDYPRDYPEPESIVNASKHGITISEVPVVMKPRKEGRSSITSLKSVYYMIKVSLAIVIASFYRKPEVKRV